MKCQRLFIEFRFSLGFIGVSQSSSKVNSLFIGKHKSINVPERETWSTNNDCKHIAKY